MKTAILYICTGKYNQFFSGFYESCEKFFLADESEKTYFVWTDDLTLSQSDNVRIFEKHCEGFPKDSLFRFDMFLPAEDELKSFDYVFFFNSNMLFLKPVQAREFVPTESDGFLCALDADFDKVYPHVSFYPYERNKRSLAYIPKDRKSYRYFHGGVNGGRTKEYLELIHTLSDNVRKDYDNGIIAQYHDESHLNRYLLDRRCKSLHSDLYGMDENANSSATAKIIIRDKTKVDAYFNKDRGYGVRRKIKRGLQLIGQIVTWYV